VLSVFSALYCVYAKIRTAFDYYALMDAALRALDLILANTKESCSGF
jgi:hypothetical protein